MGTGPCGWLSNSFHTLWTKRQAPSIPPVVHCTSRSGGESDMTNSRAASTPKVSAISSGG